MHISTSARRIRCWRCATTLERETELRLALGLVSRIYEEAMDGKDKTPANKNRSVITRRILRAGDEQEGKDSGA